MPSDVLLIVRTALCRYAVQYADLSEVKLIADPEVLATMDITRLTNTDFGALADS